MTLAIAFPQDPITHVADWWNLAGADYAHSIDPTNPNWDKAFEFLEGFKDKSIDGVVISGHGSGGVGALTLGAIRDESSDAHKFLTLLNKNLSDNGFIELRACHTASGGMTCCKELAKLTDAPVIGIDDWYAIVPHGNEYIIHPDGSFESETSTRSGMTVG